MVADVERCLTQRHSSDKQDAIGQCPLHVAVRSNADPAAMTLLIDHSASAAQVGNGDGHDELGCALRDYLAVVLGFQFRVLVPIRNRDNMHSMANGIEAMECEEAVYWLRIAMHRKNSRQALTALRTLRTDLKPRGIRL